MIAHIDYPYISQWAPEWIAELIENLARNNHLVDCGNDTRRLIEQCVEAHSGTIGKEIVRNAHIYEITSLKRKYLTTIEVNGSLTQTQYLNLFGEPSLVLLENGSYEWPVYKMMMEAYKNDREYKNIYAVLINAAIGTHRSLEELHAGGNTQFVARINSKENDPKYSGLTKYKIYPVTDSDREAENAEYLPTPKTLYRFFCGINDNSATVDRRFIDTLNQPLYNWHMWKKRAIENYFPPEAYEKIGLNADKYSSYDLLERNFKKVDKGIVEGYDKKDLQRVAASMGRKDYEDNCDKFIINGVEISEIRLFLLKMVRVV